MGFFRELFFGTGGKNTSGGEKTERVHIEGPEERQVIRDARRRVKEERIWNRRTDSWDKRDSSGSITGHVRRDALGRDVHTDAFGNVTGYDRQEGPNRIVHYDKYGKKTGYTEKDHFNNSTRHTFTDGKKKR